ncbi:MAG: LD-carboxypeptidase [Rhodothermales bacterium]
MKPSPLVPGRSAIAVIAPAGPPRSLRDLHRGCEILASRGYRIAGPPDRPPYGFLAGTDDERAAELNDALRDPSIDALFCARGGYGAMRILDRIDYDALRARPRLLVGYSDITALQLAWLSQAGVPSISGPMVGVDWPTIDPQREAQFWSLACGGIPTLDPGGDALVPVRAGAAEGTLIGGNLSLIARLIGTPYLPSLDGAILFLEDVGEAPYRIDALLCQLRLAGLLDTLAGVVLGGFTGFPDPDNDPGLFEGVIEAYFGGASYPVARGLPYGHFPEKIALPIGIHARLTVSGSHAALALLEPVVGSSDYDLV